MSSNLRHALAMTAHTINPLTCFREHKLVDARLAHFTLEAVRVVRVVPGHDCLVKDRQLTYIAAVGTVGTYGRAIGEQKEVGIGCDLVPAFSASEAVDVKERLAVEEESAHGHVKSRAIST